MGLRYDSIGKGYANQRQAEPRWERTIHNALDGSQSLLNVGAGTGNYEPPTRVVAVEPSIEMIRQRTNSHPCIQGVAEALPFADGTFDAAMAILTLHHWSDVAAGLAELRRVADRQVIFLFESLESHSFWLLDYFPEILTNAVEQNAPTVEFVGQHLNVVDVQTL